MDVTAQLLSVYQVDKQLRGLKSRLTAAERYLQGQDKDLAQLDAQRHKLDLDAKGLLAKAGDHEGEMKRVDAKLTTLRTQMESANNNKEYKAFLTELNTFKADRDKSESAALELMQRVDELKKQSAEISAKHGERAKLRAIAKSERDQREQEISGRVKELTDQRTVVIKDVPAEMLVQLQRLIDTRGDEAMAAVEIIDIKRFEFHCGSCQMAIPVDGVSALVSSGKFTRCSSCQCILYMEPESQKAIQNFGSGRKPKKNEQPVA